MRSILLLHFCPISDFFHGLQCNTEAKTLAKHFPACFLMLPTTLPSFVQIGALWIFFVPRVPPLHHFSFFVAQTPTRCKQTSKSRPSLFFWWSPPVLQVSSRLEHFKFFLSQGSPLWIIFPNFDKMQKSCIFCFSRYGPHFLTRYSGLPQEQF